MIMIYSFAFFSFVQMTAAVETKFITPMGNHPEMVYQGSTGNDIGISTAGFRSQKFNPNEWHESNYTKYYQSFVDRDNSEKIRNTSKSVIHETDATTEKNQKEATKKILERKHDIVFWIGELEREIRDVISETDLLVAQKKRLENALLATEIPLHIATDNLNCRDRRYGTDKVEDEVELALIKVRLHRFLLHISSC